MVTEEEKNELLKNELLKSQWTMGNRTLVLKEGNTYCSPSSEEKNGTKEEDLNKNFASNHKNSLSPTKPRQAQNKIGNPQSKAC